MKTALTPVSTGNGGVVCVSIRLMNVRSFLHPDDPDTTLAMCRARYAIVDLLLRACVARITQGTGIDYRLSESLTTMNLVARATDCHVLQSRAAEMHVILGDVAGLGLAIALAEVDVSAMGSTRLIEHALEVDGATAAQSPGRLYLGERAALPDGDWLERLASRLLDAGGGFVGHWHGAMGDLGMEVLACLRATRKLRCRQEGMYLQFSPCFRREVGNARGAQIGFGSLAARVPGASLGRFDVKGYRTLVRQAGGSIHGYKAFEARVHGFFFRSVPRLVKHHVEQGRWLYPLLSKPDDIAIAGDGAALRALFIDLAAECSRVLQAKLVGGVEVIAAGSTPLIIARRVLASVHRAGGAHSLVGDGICGVPGDCVNMEAM